MTIAEQTAGLLEHQDDLSFWNKLICQVREKGLSSGIAFSLKESNGPITRQLDSPQTQQVLSQEPVVLVLTHQYAYEVFAALGGLTPDSSRPFRPVKLIAEAAPPGSWLEAYLFPLYNIIPNQPNSLQKINSHRRPRPVIEPSLASQTNRESLSKAARYVGDGGLVAICPEGAGIKNASWKTGLSHLLKNSKSELGFDHEGYLVFCDVQGVGLQTYIKDQVSSLLWPRFNPFGNINVRYSQPYPMSKIDTEDDPHHLARQLESQYKRWKKSP